MGFPRERRGPPGVIGMPALILLALVALVAVAFYLDNEPVDHEQQADQKSSRRRTLYHHRH
jgi:hypothetical protein